MVENFSDEDIETVEYLILLILGKAGGRISVLHLQKIFFFLWKFHPEVKRLVEFVPHLKGPYSRDLQDIIKNPIHLTDCWNYVPPRKGSKIDRVVGGYVQITPKGKRLYKMLVDGLNEKAKEDKGALALVSAVDLIVPLYTKLEWDELLFLLYTDETNKEYSIRSELSREVFERAESIVNRLIKKGVVTKDMKEPLLERAKKSEWIIPKKDDPKDSIVIITPSKKA